jgi:lipopolysaccharide transport system permease protein
VSGFRSQVRAVARYRWLLYELVIRDVKLRYRGSVLGFAWTLLNPLLFMVIYTLVFSVVLRSNIRAYPLFLLSGLIPWTWFSSSIGQGTTAILDGRMYVGKTLLPAELLVLVPVLSNGVNFAITVVLLFPVSFALGVNAGWALVFLPLLVAIELCMALGISFFVATVNVFYRDFQQLVGYALLAIFFLTPIFYARVMVPPHLQFMVTLSPVAAMISGYQSVFYYGAPPEWGQLAFAAVFSVAVLSASLLYFNRHRDAFGEYV